MTLVAIDSNVVVYAFDEEAPKKRAVADAILVRGESVLRLPLQVVGETFRILTKRKLLPDVQAQAVLVELMELFTTIPFDQGSVRVAMRLFVAHSIPYWDALLVATAASHRCGLLLSEDFQDGRVFAARDAGGSAVRIVNPFAAKNRPLLEAAGVLSPVSEL